MTVKKKKGFFDDVTETADDIEVTQKNENAVVSDEDENRNGNETVSDVSQNAETEDKQETGGGLKKKTKCRNIAVFSGIATVLCAFLFVSIAYFNGWFGGKHTDENGEETNKPKEEFFFYPADYLTDIFTIPEYLALDRRVKYSPDSSQSYLIENGNYAAEGAPGLTVIGEYLNAVIAGDHEKVNSLYTEKFIEENGRHERFPPQKLFMIKIKNERVTEEKDGYTVYYFTVSYRIYRNDGLFRDNVDEEREHAQIFEVFVYSDDTEKINLVKERPGYDLGWM